MARITDSSAKAAIIEERWRMAVMDGQLLRYGNEQSITKYMTKRWHRIQRDMEDIAALLCDEGVRDHEYEGDPNQPDALMAVTARVWQFMHDELTAWASREPERWEAWHSQQEVKAAS